jgi:DNA-nicking Smr family endonuclease
MAKPPPDPGETNWRRIKATVKPLKKKSPSLSGEGLGVGARVCAPNNISAMGRNPAPTPPLGGKASAKPPLLVVAPDLIRGRSRPDTLPTAPAQGRSDGVGAAPLAKDWEHSLRNGRLHPDMTIDLHGHNLAGAHSALSRALDRAAGQGVRVILIIAGKSRGPDEAPRGAIRRELETWLAHSHHARRILAVRNAHPRHGGAGAVYVVLRKG